MTDLFADGPFAVGLTKYRDRRTRASRSSDAAEAVGTFGKGALLFGVTKGRFSMLDLIEHVLSITGPADVDVSTWTMGVYDADVLWRFAQLKRIKAIRFLVDPSMFGRKPDLAEAFIAAFGGPAIRACDNHAKFTLIGNERWSVTISSSMNLNRNTRLENYVLAEAAEVYGFYKDIVERVFAALPPYSTRTRRTVTDLDRVDLGDGCDDGAEVW